MPTTKRHLARRKAKKWWWRTRVPTARFRTLPDFIIIGAQKSGTTSLYHLLLDHPQVKRPFGQEPTYFSHEVNFNRGREYYQVNFPLVTRGRRSPSKLDGWITGEASGEYLYYPAAPERIEELLPNVRLIVVLRDPVERTISSYHHNVRRSLETRPLEEVVAEELSWRKGEVPYVEPDHRRFGPLGGHGCILGRSCYADHLPRWLERFPTSRLMIVEAESLFDSPVETLTRVQQFLELAPTTTMRADTYNRGSSSDVDVAMRNQLREFFRSPNERLAALLDEAYRPGRIRLRWVGP